MADLGEAAVTGAAFRRKAREQRLASANKLADLLRVLRLFGGFELNALPGSDKVALPGKRERVLPAILKVANF